jgi:hypothetical protein
MAFTAVAKIPAKLMRFMCGAHNKLSKRESAGAKKPSENYLNRSHGSVLIKGEKRGGGCRCSLIRQLLGFCIAGHGRMNRFAGLLCLTARRGKKSGAAGGGYKSNGEGPRTAIQDYWRPVSGLWPGAALPCCGRCCMRRATCIFLFRRILLKSTCLCPIRR